MEYIFHPPPILALMRAVPLPPAGILAGETVMVSDTGFCAWIPAANKVAIEHRNII